MEASTTILGMTGGNIILVPDYQRAYSWDTNEDKSSSLLIIRGSTILIARL